MEKGFFANRQRKVDCVYVFEKTTPDEDQCNQRKLVHLEVHWLPFTDEIEWRRRRSIDID